MFVLVILYFFTGNLAERSLGAVIPEDFPFAVRLVSQVLESNGEGNKVRHVNCVVLLSPFIIVLSCGNIYLLTNLSSFTRDVLSQLNLHTRLRENVLSYSLHNCCVKASITDTSHHILIY